MVKSIYLPEEYKVYRDKTKKEYQERFHAHDFVHMRLKCTRGRNLLKVYGCKSVAYVEEHYCCYGPEQSCWEAPYWKGLWNMSERKVRRFLFEIIREKRPYLQDPERVFKFKTDNVLHIYFFCGIRIISTIFGFKLSKQRNNVAGMVAVMGQRE